MDNGSPSENTTMKRQLSKYAIAGAAILPFGLLLVLLFIPVSATTGPTITPTWQIALRYALLLLAVIAPFASTALGFMSISQIRKSKSAIYGLPLAVFVGLFYPIIFLTLFLIFLGWTFLAPISGSSLIPLAWLFLILLLDYLIVRFSWSFAKRGS